MGAATTAGPARAVLNKLEKLPTWLAFHVSSAVVVVLVLCVVFPLQFLAYIPYQSAASDVQLQMSTCSEAIGELLPEDKDASASERAEVFHIVDGDTLQ